MNGDEALEQVQSFFINNKQLDKIERYIRKLNVFRILGVETMEIKHSNMLAWLFNPNETHNLGDKVFKRFLLEAVTRWDFDISCSEVMTSNYSDLIIRREWHNIDLFALSKTNKLILVVENKVNAEESEYQLEDYYNAVNKEFGNEYRKIFLFLTLNGELPKKDKDRVRYCPVAYQTLWDCVDNIANRYKEEISPNVYNFIEQYLDVLGEQLMNDEKLAAVCKAVYKENKKAIELILEYGKPRIPIEKMNDFHAQTVTMSDKERSQSLTYYSFIPSEWESVVPAKNIYTQNRWLIYYQLDFSKFTDDKPCVYLGLFIGNFPAEYRRDDFITGLNDILNENGIQTVSTRSKTSTTVKSYRIDVKDYIDVEDYDSIINAIADMYLSDEQTVYRKHILEAAKNMNWSV